MQSQHCAGKVLQMEHLIVPLSWTVNYSTTWQCIQDYF